MAGNGESNGKWLPVVGDLPHGWDVVEFGEVLDGGTRNGIYKKKEFHGRGAKIVNMGELFGHPRMFDVEMKRVELTDKELEKSSLQAGDLLFARRSLVAEGAGKCSVVCEVNEPTTFESSIIRARPDGSKVDSLFLYYMFSSPFGRYSLDTIRRTVAVSGITGSDLVTLDIPLPPLSEQKAIAEILGALDAKIELNRRMNETLESLARALFKSWFVDFDPVRAKLDSGTGVPPVKGPLQNQRRDAPATPPNLPPATAALFPDSFEHHNGELVPTGWSSTSLGDEVDLFTGFPFKSKDYTDDPDSVRLVRGDNVIQGRLRWQNVKRWPSDMLDGLDDYQLRSGDVVLAMDRPWIEAGLKYAWIGNHDLPCFLVQRVARLRSNGSGIGTGLTRLLIGSPQFAQHVLAVQTGTAVPHISSAQIKSFEFVLPPSSDRQLVHRFEDAIAPLLTRFDSNAAESETLAALRDTLLPRLLSGELRVADAERSAAEAVT